MAAAAILVLLTFKFQRRVERTALAGSRLGNFYAWTLNGFSRVKRLHEALPVSSEDLLNDSAETAGGHDLDQYGVSAATGFVRPVDTDLIELLGVAVAFGKNRADMADQRSVALRPLDSKPYKQRAKEACYEECW